jgi:anti-sigma B factor antagonist
MSNFSAARPQRFILRAMHLIGSGHVQVQICMTRTSALYLEQGEQAARRHTVSSQFRQMLKVGRLLRRLMPVKVVYILSCYPYSEYNVVEMAALMPKKYDVHGDLDANYVEAFRAQIDSLAQSEEDAVLDLSRVSFIDSSGIGALVSLHRKLIAKGHKLKVTGLHGQPLQLFINLQLIPVFCGHV